MNRPAVFFDRDNTLIACDGYLGDPAKVMLVEGAAQAIVRVRELGYAAVIFSNQSGVARGLFTEEAVHAVNHRLDDLLHEEDPRAIIDRHDFCPFHPTAKVPKYRVDSDLRKPKPGMIYQAQRALGLDLARSWVIGDAPRDIAAGHAAGLRTILLRIASLPPSPATNEGAGVSPEFIATSLEEAVGYIERNGLPATTQHEHVPAHISAHAVEGSAAQESPEFDSGVTEAAASELAAPEITLPEPNAAEPASAESVATGAANGLLASAEPAAEPGTSTPEQPLADSVEVSANGQAFTPSEGEQGPEAEQEVAQAEIAPIAQETARTPAESEPASDIAAAPATAEAVAHAAPEFASGRNTVSSAGNTEGPVKLTPRPTFKTTESRKAEPAAPKPAQGGIVVKPNTTPGMTWGERMRLAKQGVTPPMATPASQTMPADEADDVDLPPPPPRAVARVPVVRLPEPEPVVEPTPEPPVVDEAINETEAPPEVSPAESSPEPLRGQRREDASGESGQAVTIVRNEHAEPAPRSRRMVDLAGDSGRVEDLLEQILIELRRREEQPVSDFSVSKLLAGITQVLALAAMFFAYLNRDNGKLEATLMLAVTLQTLTISLLIMGRQK